MSGYVRIHRSLIGHPAFRNDAEAMAFAWMVARAAWKPVRVRYKGHDIALERGQLTISIRDFADKMDRPKGWAERLFARLREHGMIAQKSGTQVGTQVGTHGGTVGGTPANVVTICNYDDYQADGEMGETPGRTPDETDAGHEPDTEQRREEGKEVSKEDASHPLRASPLPVDDAVAIWNEVAGQTGWPTIRRLSDARRAALRARLRDEGLDGWKAAIARAHASRYLGHDPPSWFTFDWITKAGNFLKLTEGNYDRNLSHNTGQRGASSGWEAAYNSNLG